MSGDFETNTNELSAERYVEKTLNFEDYWKKLKIAVMYYVEI